MASFFTNFRFLHGVIPSDRGRGGSGRLCGFLVAAFLVFFYVVCLCVMGSKVLGLFSYVCLWPIFFFVLNL